MSAPDRIVQVDHRRCVGCGECTLACPEGALKGHSGKAWLDEERCTACHLCLPACHYGALDLKSEP